MKNTFVSSTFEFYSVLDAYHEIGKSDDALLKVVLDRSESMLCTERYILTSIMKESKIFNFLIVRRSWMHS